MNINCILDNTIVSMLNLSVITELQVCRRMILFLGDICSGVMINV